MIDVLLATYNSEKYISEQLISILEQDYTDFKIIISDDYSTDNTIQIINDFIIKYPNKIELTTTNKNIGAKENFNKLLSLSTANYIMFSDHDDVWFSDKISKTLNAMKVLENKNSTTTPLLVFTDKSITDENLNILHTSCSIAENFNTSNLTLNRLLVQNVASGCTMMINKTLLNKCKTIPNEAIMHDYWLILVAILFGDVFYIDEPAMLYRQHSSNELGASAYNIKYIINKFKSSKRKNINGNIMQAEALLHTYKDSISNTQIDVLENFVKLKTASPLEYRYIIFKYGFFKSGLALNIGVLLRFK